MFKEGEKVYYNSLGMVHIAKVIKKIEKQYIHKTGFLNLQHETEIRIHYIIEYKEDVYEKGLVATKDSLFRVVVREHQLIGK